PNFLGESTRSGRVAWVEIEPDDLGRAGPDHLVYLHLARTFRSVVKSASGRRIFMGLVITVAFLFAIVALVVYLVTIFNGLVALKNDIDKSWANINMQRQHAHDTLTQ